MIEKIEIPNKKVESIFSLALTEYLNEKGIYRLNDVRIRKLSDLTAELFSFTEKKFVTPEGRMLFLTESSQSLRAVWSALQYGVGR